MQMKLSILYQVGLETSLEGSDFIFDGVCSITSFIKLILNMDQI